MPKHTTLQKGLDVTTVLGASTGFTGTLRFDSSLMIRGRFDGDIEAKGALYIDEGAVVKAGRIRAMSVFVAGSVTGDIEAADKVEFRSTAQVRGNVRTARLRISDGVLFEGRCEMLQDRQESDGTEARPAP